MKNIKIKESRKFKDTLISLRFATNDLEDISARSLLAMMLVDTCQRYPSKVAMNEVLDLMYGAILNARVLNYGKAHVLEICLSVLNSDFVEEDLLSKQLDLLEELVFRPMLTEKKFKEAQKKLLDLLKRQEEDPSNYVVRQALSLADKDAVMAYSRLGNKEDVENLELQDILNIYDKLLFKDQLSINVIGNVDKKALKERLVASYQAQLSEKSLTYTYDHDKYQIMEEREHVVLDQDYFALVYISDIKVDHDLYWPLQLAVMMLGQLSSSFLFQEIREKRSLSYSTYASLIPYDAVMIMSGGIRKGHLDEAISVSKEQLVRLQDGNFEESLLDEAKMVLSNQLLASADDNLQLVNSEYRRLLLKEEHTLDDTVEDLKTISSKDIVEAAKHLTYCASYRLEGVNHEENL